MQSSLFGVRDMTERDFQSGVLVPCLKDAGYLVSHVFRLRTSNGEWRTSCTLKGLPDLMGVGRGHTLWIEVKGPKTPITIDQLLVLDAFADGCPTNRCWVLRPNDDWDAIVQWIYYPADAPVRYGFDDEMIRRAARNPTRRTSKH